MKGEIRTNKILQGISDNYLLISKRIDSALWSPSDFAENQAFIVDCMQSYSTNIKYKGKYAFIRVLHAQEICSSLFSLFSAISAALCLFFVAKMESKRTRKDSSTSSPNAQKVAKYFHFLKCVLALHSATWLGSCVFHIRDCYATQCLDYFGAILSISSTIFLSIKRLSISADAAQYFLSVFVACHILYMHFIHFDFLYNAAICGVLFGVNVGLWTLWYMRIKSAVYSRLLKISIFGMVSAACFQIVDFGPVYFILDSHALWHILGWIFSCSLHLFIAIDANSLLKDFSAFA
ncbi:post-GPI attachment to proteins factor 3 [Nematocida minor]|uniref:post-GPI attachment to proteins factor 3 n=1 Tax=Nematocida minor TaxID=1912983 RepID=UPI00221F61AD|nr:post-GPI attachment to proteins factor 3 [Nematocida minor]KAI5192803.1 post-GPI attachment to proteins factor 3 [Nematocida minor]